MLLGSLSRCRKSLLHVWLLREAHYVVCGWLGWPALLVVPPHPTLAYSVIFREEIGGYGRDSFIFNEPEEENICCGLKSDG